MTMKIEVTIPEGEIQAGASAQYLARAMEAIGYSRGVSLPLPAVATPGCANPAVAAPSAANLENYIAGIAAEREEVTQAAAAEQAEAPKRERGKPSPGRARRTKEEIAEDEAADAAEAAAPLTVVKHVTLPDDATSEQVAEAFAGLKANISTGEERIDPATAEDAAQDAADEAAEAEVVKPKELSHDDVRAALQKYVTRFGMAAAMEDGPKVFTMLFGDEVVKVSAVPSDQDSLGKAVAGIEEMLTKNPFKREVEL